MLSLAEWSIYKVKLMIAIIRLDGKNTENYIARDLTHQWVKQTDWDHNNNNNNVHSIWKVYLKLVYCGLHYAVQALFCLRSAALNLCSVAPAAQKGAAQRLQLTHSVRVWSIQVGDESPLQHGHYCVCSVIKFVWISPCVCHTNWILFYSICQRGGTNRPSGYWVSLIFLRRSSTGNLVKASYEEQLVRTSELNWWINQIYVSWCKYTVAVCVQESGSWTESLSKWCVSYYTCWLWIRINI